MEVIVKRKQPQSDELYHYKYIKRYRGRDGEWCYVYYDKDSVYSKNKHQAELDEINSDIDSLENKLHKSHYDQDIIDKYIKLKDLKEDVIAKGEAWFEEFSKDDGTSAYSKMRNSDAYNEYNKAKKKYNRRKKFYEAERLISTRYVDLNDY